MPRRPRLRTMGDRRPDRPPRRWFDPSSEVGDFYPGAVRLQPKEYPKEPIPLEEEGIIEMITSVPIEIAALVLLLGVYVVWSRQS